MHLMVVIAITPNFGRKKKKQWSCKPGYVVVTRRKRRLSFICLPCCHDSIAVYPSAMDEQPLDADILDLATRR